MQREVFSFHDSAAVIKDEDAAAGVRVAEAQGRDGEWFESPAYGHGVRAQLAVPPAQRGPAPQVQVPAVEGARSIISNKGLHNWGEAYGACNRALSFAR